MNNVFISIIVACRNEERYIEKCIDSLLRQSLILGNIEILIIDGESSDRTYSIIKQLSLKDSRIRIFRNNRSTKVFAVNIGFKEAKGEFIAICDAHAEYDSYYLSECLKVLESDSSVSCVSGPIRSKGETNFGKAVAIAMSNRIGVGSSAHRNPCYNGFCDTVIFPLFRRELLNKIGLYDEYFEINHDDDYCYRIIKTGGKLFINSSAKCTYYVRNDPFSLFSQFFQYGYWQLAFYMKHKVLRSIRQYVPISFLLLAITSLIISIYEGNLWFFLTIPMIYSTIILIYSFIELLANELKIIKNLPAVLVILHISYAIGFVIGTWDFMLKPKLKSLFS